MLTRAVFTISLAGFMLFGCDRTPEPGPARAAPSLGAKPSPTPSAAPGGSSSASAAAAPASTPEADPRYPAPARLVAIGDIHGDLDAARKVLRLAGAIDDKDHWAGGALVLVQTGDLLDRGDGERAIVDLFDRLGDEAKAAGGAVHALNGNHEVMNVSLDFRYVTDGGYKDFDGVPGANPNDPRARAVPDRERSRAAALLPGAPYARKLAKRDTIVIVGDTVFVHGGVLPKHVKYGISRINREVSAWMNGDASQAPSIVTSEDGPIWTRRYSAAPDSSDCAVLKEALDALHAKRMVVGHTVQRDGITAACEEKVWRIDVGLSHAYGGKPAVLEIRGDKVKALGEGDTPTAPPSASAAPAPSAKAPR